MCVCVCIHLSRTSMAAFTIPHTGETEDNLIREKACVCVCVCCVCVVCIVSARVCVCVCGLGYIHLKACCLGLVLLYLCISNISNSVGLRVSHLAQTVMGTTRTSSVPARVCVWLEVRVSVRTRQHALCVVLFVCVRECVSVCV